MVGLVLVSHSHALAEATVKLIQSISGGEVPVVIAAGIGENHQELGTDAMEILQAIQSLDSTDGIVIVMDMGSAVLSTDMALGFLDEETKKKVHLSPAPFVEGAMAGAVMAKTGGNVEDVLREATGSLKQKTEHIQPETNQPEAEKSTSDEKSETTQVTITIPHGLHARPVSKLVQAAAQYRSNIQIKNVTNGKGPASIKSITGIMALGALYGHTIELSAQGEDARQAIEELKVAIEKGLGDTLEEKPTQVENPSDNTPVKNSPQGVSKGIVIGPAYYPDNTSFEFPDETTTNPEHEINTLQTALTVTKDVLMQKANEIAQKAGEKEAAIFQAQATMVDDPAIREEAEQLIREKKMQAGKAWWLSVKDVIDRYKQFPDATLRQKALDLQDAAQLVLIQFGIADTSILDIPEPGIIIVDDLTPGQVASLDTTKIQGVICMENGQTSHSSILLRSRGIPAIVQAQYAAVSLRELPPSTLLAMDGSTGEIQINPGEEELQKIRDKQKQWIEQIEQEKKESEQAAQTADGKRIEVFANVGNKEDALLAKQNNAEGIGLLRTEFMFLDRDKAPGEEEQVQLLQEIVEPMKGKPVIIRTLDAGGDKELPYLNQPKEANPFLGVRAIRLTLKNKDLFQQQLRAILRVGAGQDIRIMFPMISRLEELKEAKTELEKAHQSLEKQNIPHLWPIVTGMMMEVPSAALLADQFVKEVDFVSIGTNDLIQYTLASDRGNPALEQPSNDSFDPAVLKLIVQIGKACKKQGIQMAVCGESAAQTNLAGILLAAGATELSMNPNSIPELKAWIRTQKLNDLENRLNTLPEIHYF